MFQRTHRWIRQQIKRHGNEGRTLEIGSYYEKRSPRDLFPDYVGLDKRPGPGVDIVMDANKIYSSQKFKKNSFSRVLCISILEHAPNFEIILKGINHILKPGGQFYFVVPAYGFPLHYSDPEIPDDYWRFSELAIKEIFMKGYKILSWHECLSAGPSGGSIINCLGEKMGFRTGRSKRIYKYSKHLINDLNKSTLLMDDLLPFVGDKKEIKIADIGSGPVSQIGSFLPGVKVKIYPSDKKDFTQWWKDHNQTPFISVECQNMEKLTYPDDFFDIVWCRNAVDHTRNAKEAVKEMIRVCKIGGWVCIICSLDQLSTGYRHCWNAKQDGIFTNNKETFDLKEFGFQIQFIDNGGESRNNLITATLKK